MLCHDLSFFFCGGTEVEGGMYNKKYLRIVPLVLTIYVHTR